MTHTQLDGTRRLLLVDATAPPLEQTQDLRTANSLDPSATASTWLAVVAIVSATFIVYLPALSLPYYFVDDLWLYRPPDSGFPDVTEVVMFRQGRPVFGLLALLLRHLRNSVGIQAITIARGVAIAGLGVFAFCVYLFIRRWHTALTALCLTVLLIILPSLQMYVTAAPLFAPSLAYCGFVVLLFGGIASRERNTSAHWMILLAATLGLVTVWATYQAMPLIVVSLLTPMLLSESWRMNPRWPRLAMFLIAVAASLLLYYALWRYANIGIAADRRYSPTAIGFHIAENVKPYLALRVPQIFSFWDTRANGRPFLYESMVLVGLACAIDLYRSCGRRVLRAAAWAFAIIAIVAVDAPLFFAPASNTFSYMTSAPSAAAAFLVVAMAARVLVSAIVPMAPVLRRYAAFAVLLVCAAVVGAAARNVLINHVLPNWLEYALVRSELRRQLSGPPISAVTLFARPTLLATGRLEFSWSNFSGDFWAYWAVRDILDELGADSRVYIDILNADGTKSVLPGSYEAQGLTPPESGRHVTVDLRSIDLTPPPAVAMRRPPPLPSFQDFWSRQSELRLAPGLMRNSPSGLSILPIAGIRSTLTWPELGASGENSAIDQNLETWAADPKGFHHGTFIELSLRSVADVSGVRILSARDFGVQLPGTLRVMCLADGRPGEVAILQLRAGFHLVSQTSWPVPCRTQAVRLEATGQAVGTNFWIAEVQIFGTTVQ